MIWVHFSRSIVCNLSVKIGSRQGSFLHVLMEGLICELIRLVVERVAYLVVVVNHLSLHQQLVKVLVCQ